jgi:hypothetical protein
VANTVGATERIRAQDKITPFFRDTRKSLNRLEGGVLALRSGRDDLGRSEQLGALTESIVECRTVIKTFESKLMVSLGSPYDGTAPASALFVESRSVCDAVVAEAYGLSF